jgi:2-polyprenyl-3-methyl-5-hydroxy-6-metoxy-1,4-benzoquinol methylase
MVVSVDIDKDALKFGKIVITLIACTDATHLPFRKHMFDSIVSLETMEHVRDQMTFLNNIKCGLKEGGS